MRMKKTIFVCVGLLLALSYGGCGHSDSEERTEKVLTPDDSTGNVSVPEEPTVNLLVSFAFFRYRSRIF